jgi:hypothetical protein
MLFQFRGEHGSELEVLSLVSLLCRAQVHNLEGSTVLLLSTKAALQMIKAMPLGNTISDIIITEKMEFRIL